MQILIIGGGKVGETLIEHLSEEGNDITLIDQDPLVVESLSNSYDIIGYEGSGTSYDTLADANVNNADMFLSVTQSDEINIISALMAKQMGARFAIARVRSPEYSEHLEFMIEKLGIDLVINPDQAAAYDIERILKFPHALDLESFAAGRVQLVETLVEEGSPLAGKALYQLPSMDLQILVCIVTRNGESFIPRGDFVLQERDQIYVTGTFKDLSNYSRILGFSREKIQNVFIVGGGRITQYLVKRLLKTGKRVKIVELDPQRAEELATVFPQAIVIRGDGTHQELLEAEGIRQYDAVLSLTGIDEENILLSMYAASLEIPRTITKVNRTSLLKILQNVGLQTIVTPKNLMANLIVRAVRARENRSGSQIETLYKLADNRVEALEFRIAEDPALTGIPLRELEISRDTLLVYVLRDRQILFPTGETTLKPNDRAILVTTRPGVRDLRELID